MNKTNNKRGEKGKNNRRTVWGESGINQNNALALL